MYLTEEEFKILQGLKFGLSFTEISKELNKSLRTCDPRIDSLYQKYGVIDRLELSKKADLKKVTVANIEEIPYWEYEGTQLVQSIPICKKAVENIISLLLQVEDDKKEFKIIYSANKLNKFWLLDNGVEKIYLYRQKPVLEKKFFSSIIYLYLSSKFLGK